MEEINKSGMNPDYPVLEAVGVLQFKIPKRKAGLLALPSLRPQILKYRP